MSDKQKTLTKPKRVYLSDSGDAVRRDILRELAPPQPAYRLVPSTNNTRAAARGVFCYGCAKWINGRALANHKRECK